MAMRSLSGDTPGTDPDYVSVVEVFDNLSHAEIHTAVRQLDPAALSGAGQLFLTTATGLGDEVDNAHAEIRAAIADGWRGAAAQSAADAVRDFEQSGRRIADVLTAVGVRLCQAGDAAESVRSAVTEPETTQPDPAAALLDSEQAATNATVARQAENARLDAVRAMETIYAGVLLPTGSGVPAFSATAAETGTAAAPSAVPGATSTASADRTSTVTTPVTATGATVAAAATAPGPAATLGGASPAGVGNTPAAPTSTTPSATTPGATTPATVAPANVVGSGRAVPGSSGAVSGSSAPGAAGAVVPGATGTPAKVGDGRTRRERPTGSGTTTPAATSASTATAGTAETPEIRQDREPAMAGGEAAAGMGAGAMGGLMGGAMAADAARAPGGPRPAAPPPEPEDEDDEFLRFLDEEPTYLEPADDVNPLIGRMDPTSPAVLGEWTGRE